MKYATGDMIADFIDDLHRECVKAQIHVRNEFARARAMASIWEPRPCPARFVPVDDRTPYLDEVERQRGWFR